MFYCSGLCPLGTNDLPCVHLQVPVKESWMSAKKLGGVGFHSNDVEIERDKHSLTNSTVDAIEGEAAGDISKSHVPTGHHRIV